MPKWLTYGPAINRDNRETGRGAGFTWKVIGLILDILRLSCNSTFRQRHYVGGWPFESGGQRRYTLGFVSLLAIFKSWYLLE